MLTGRQIPQELLSALTEIKSGLSTLEYKIKQNQIDAKDSYLQIEIILDRAVKLLREYTSEQTIFDISYADLLSFRDEKYLKSGVGAIIFRELFSVLMLSNTMSLLYARPRGVLEDFESVQLMHKNDPAGDGPLGPLVDKWFLNRPICRGRRGEVVFVETYLQNKTDFSITALCDLAAGSAIASFIFIKKDNNALLTCIDNDINALRNIQEEATACNLLHRVKAINSDLRELWADGSQIDIDQQDIALALGIFEYLEDQDIIDLFNWLNKHLSPGGSLLFSTIMPSHPDLILMSNLLEWRVKPRSRAKLHELFDKSSLSQRAKLNIIETENHMIYATVEVKKK